MIEGQDMQPIWRLLYSSQQVLGGDDIDARDAARTIANASRHRNAAAGLTGCLLFVDNAFIQVLEGPCESVEETFERICRDFRHVDVRLVDFIAVPDRMFADWEMALLCEDRETSIALREELDELRFLVGVNARQAVEQMRCMLLANGTSAELPTNSSEAASPPNGADAVLLA